MTMNSRITKFCLALAMALGAGPLQAATPLSIGVLNDMSGAYSDAGGRGSVVAAEMAASDFGSTVLGRPIRILSKDHQNKPDVGVSIAAKWFDDENVSMITDLSFSSVGLAVQHLADLRGKITIDTGAASSAFIGKDCSPTGFLWSFNTYSTTAGLVEGVMGRGAKTWALIVADYSYGNQVAADVAREVDKRDGKILTSVKYPFGSTDFSSALLTMQTSGANVIGFATGGTDLVNVINQAYEFQIPNAQALVALGGTMFDFHSVGLQKAQGLLALEPFYWNRNEESRAFALRFVKAFGKPPGAVHASTYSAVLHYLKAVAAAGTDDGKIVAAKMRELPVEDVFTHGGHLRADGWLDHDQFLVQVKSPSQSSGEWDVYNVIETVSPASSSPPLLQSTCPLVKN